MAELGVDAQAVARRDQDAMRLSGPRAEGGISMGDMARGLGCDPSYITALVDDLDAQGLATREPSPVDRRVKIIVLTEAGRELAGEIRAVLSVPPSTFAALSKAELGQLRDLLDKVISADTRVGVGVGAGVGVVAGAVAGAGAAAN